MIVLVGFMGAGKTTVGQLLAGRLGLPFTDSDQVIEQRAGRPVRQIFAEDGEPAFRALEHQVIAEPAGRPRAGPGRGRRRAPSIRAPASCLAAAQVVYLQVSYEQALARVGGDDGRPMLARPGLAETYQRRLTALRAGRHPHRPHRRPPGRGRQPGHPGPAGQPARRRRPGSARPAGALAVSLSPMRIGMTLNYTGGFAETVDELADFERAGLDIVFVAELYSFDAVSQMGFIAARTERLQIALGHLARSTRVPPRCWP